MFTSSNDESAVRPQHSNINASSPACRSATPSPPEHYNQYQEQSYADFKDVAWDDDTPSTEEHFPKAPLDDNIWSKDPFPDRPLCIHKRHNELSFQCTYPCPYSMTTFRMDLLQSTP